ncbi:hypothetical protein Pfl01_0224 [Pseudomonas fluorescens Pf0-1]|uniref:Uncharacterized protein n=1 Tax=Pseudomonas fluorescens (strain Pf0-1) TaxID=205922 RepID=Q3KJT8_PSEPF|nr:hypothetical protein Pfl01_0224 [Pseudomonas fluorescens Pf0-1]
MVIGVFSCVWLTQAALVFSALRKATSHFTKSCGSGRCGTFTSMFSSLLWGWPGESGQKLFVLGGLLRKKDPSYSERKNSLLILSEQTRRIVFCVISICFNGI